jgi:hypothetical protein
MTKKEFDEKYLPIVDGDESINFPDNWKSTEIHFAIVDNKVKYAWKSPTFKGDTFYGWIRLTKYNEIN